MMQNELTAKRPVAGIGEEISHELGAKMIRDYEQSNPNEVRGLTIGKNIIQQILSQPGCEGIRFYNAVNEEGQKTLVYLGVDRDGKPIIEYSFVDGNGEIAKKRAIVADRAGKGDEDWFGWFRRIFG